MLINATTKMFPKELELEFGYLILCTESNIPKKGVGVSSLAFKVRKTWIEKDGNVVVYAEPNEKVDRLIFNKYGDIITEKELKVNESSKKGMFFRPHGYTQPGTQPKINVDKHGKKGGHQKGSTKEKV